MKFTYTGNGDDDQETVSLYGYTFTLGEATEVTDAKAIAKFKTNSHFTQGEAEPVKRKPGRPPKAKPVIVQIDLPDED